MTRKYLRVIGTVIVDRRETFNVIDQGLTTSLLQTESTSLRKRGWQNTTAFLSGFSRIEQSGDRSEMRMCQREGLFIC